jgi:hypothetical protein
MHLRRPDLASRDSSYHQRFDLVVSDAAGIRFINQGSPEFRLPEYRVGGKPDGSDPPRIRAENPGGTAHMVSMPMRDDQVADTTYREVMQNGERFLCPLAGIDNDGLTRACQDQVACPKSDVNEYHIHERSLGRRL